MFYKYYKHVFHIDVGLQFLNVTWTVNFAVELNAYAILSIHYFLNVAFVMQLNMSEHKLILFNEAVRLALKNTIYQVCNQTKQIANVTYTYKLNR